MAGRVAYPNERIADQIQGVLDNHRKNEPDFNLMNVADYRRQHPRKFRSTLEARFNLVDQSAIVELCKLYDTDQNFFKNFYGERAGLAGLQ